MASIEHRRRHGDASHAVVVVERGLAVGRRCHGRKPTRRHPHHRYRCWHTGSMTAHDDSRPVFEPPEPSLRAGIEPEARGLVSYSGAPVIIGVSFDRQVMAQQFLLAMGGLREQRSARAQGRRRRHEGRQRLRQGGRDDGLHTGPSCAHRRDVDRPARAPGRRPGRLGRRAGIGAATGAVTARIVDLGIS